MRSLIGYVLLIAIKPTISQQSMDRCLINNPSKEMVNGIFFNDVTKVFNVYRGQLESRFRLRDNSFNPILIESNSFKAPKPDTVTLMTSGEVWTFKSDQVCFYNGSLTNPIWKPCLSITNGLFRDDPDTERILTVLAGTTISDPQLGDHLYIIVLRITSSNGVKETGPILDILRDFKDEHNFKPSSTKITSTPPNAMSYLGRHNSTHHKVLMFYKNINAEYFRTDKELLSVILPEHNHHWRLSKSWFDCPPELCFDAEFDAIDNEGSETIRIAGFWESRNLKEFEQSSQLVDAITTTISGKTIKIINNQVHFGSDKIDIEKFFPGHKEPIDALVRIDDNKIVVISYNQYSQFAIEGQSTKLINGPRLLNTRWSNLPIRLNGAMTIKDSIQFQYSNFVYNVQIDGGVAEVRLVQEDPNFKCSEFDYKQIPRFLQIKSLETLIEFRFRTLPTNDTSTETFGTNTISSTTINSSGPGSKSSSLMIVMIVVAIVTVILIVIAGVLYECTRKSKKVKKKNSMLMLTTSPTVKTDDSSVNVQDHHEYKSNKHSESETI